MQALAFAAGRFLGLALALAFAAGPLCAQLPAPPVSARGPLWLGGWGTIVLGESVHGAPVPGATTAGAAAGGATGGTTGATGGTGATGSTPSAAESPREGVVESTAALLVSGTLARLSYFGEVDGASRTWQNWPGQREDRSLEVNRLYAEVSLGDALRLRAGRFLTPIGQWNEAHADPLTWTTQRPLTTYRPFAKSVTGAMVAGEVALGSHDAGYAVFAAPFGNTGNSAQETAFMRGVGARAAVELRPGLYLGGSTAFFRASWPYAADEDSAESGGAEESGGADASVLPRASVAASQEAAGETGDWEYDRVTRHLFGADLSWCVGRAELLAEGVALSAGAGHPAERGGFVQAALPVAPPLYLVLRTEAYDPVVYERLMAQTIGVVLRPGRHVILKLERQLTDHPSSRLPEGWFVSASAIF